MEGTGILQSSQEARNKPYLCQATDMLDYVTADSINYQLMQGPYRSNIPILQIQKLINKQSLQKLH